MIKVNKLVFGRFDYATFLVFIAYAAGSVVVPVVLVKLARDLGFSLEEGGMTEGGVLHLGRSIAVMASTAVCGFIAGRWGKRRTLGWSVVLMGIGMALCAVTPGYGILLLAMMIAGLGEGVIEGLATPFVQDLHPDEPGRYINFAHGFWSVGVLAAVLVSGGLLSLGVSWRLLVGSIMVLAMIPAVMILRQPADGPKYPDHPEPLHWTIVRDQSIAIMRIPQFWIFFWAMFVAGGGEFCLTFWTATYIQLNFASSAWAGGIGTAFFAAGMVASRTGWPHLIKQQHLGNLILWSAIGGIVVTLFFPLSTSLWLLFGLLFLSGIATGPFWPSVQSYCTDCLPKADSTMIFILLSCAGIPGCGFFTWLMGWVGNHYGLKMAFYIVPGCYLVLAGLMAYAQSFQRNQQKKIV
jgi:MFS family permease